MFKKRYLVTFHMKSGNKLVFECDKFTYKRSANGSVESYDVENVRQGALFYADLKEIEAITFIVKRRFWS